MHPASERPIALVGLMGAGKTSVARLLGERLAVAVADLDAMLEAESGDSVARFFEKEGEAAFRRRERELLAQALAAGARVIACGGGAVLDAASRTSLKTRCRTVWLEVSPEVAADRVGADAAGRPMLDGGEPRARLAALETERAPLYREVAEVRVATDGRTPEQVADAVLTALEGAPR